MVALFLGLTFFAIKVNSERNAATVEALESRINQVIIGTLKAVKEDLGVLAPGREVKPGPENEKEEKKLPQLEGVENLAIFGDEFFIDGRRFSAGQCVYPWGVCISVLPTSVVFVGLDGGLTVLCKSGRAVDKGDAQDKPGVLRRGSKETVPAAPLSSIAG